MVNRRYLKGLLFEYEVRDHLADMGFFVVRAARSRGTRRHAPPVDLVAIKDGRVYVVECKAWKCGRKPKPDPELIELSKRYGFTYLLVTPDNLKETLAALAKEE